LKNTIQVIGLCLYNLGLMIYAAVQTDQIRDAVLFLSAPTRNEVRPEFWPDIKPLLIAVPCILALGSIVLGGIAWKLYDEFAWTIYKHISADVRMKKRYMTYQVSRLDDMRALRTKLTKGLRSTSLCSSSTFSSF